MKKLLCLSYILLFLTQSLFSSELATQTSTQLDDEEQSSQKPRMSAGGSTTFFNILRLGPNQGVYLLGETHDFDVPGREINRRHVDVLFNMLVKAELARPTKKYHVLIEHCIDTKHDNSADNAPYSLLTKLYPAFKKQPFLCVKMEDFAVRSQVFSLLMLLNVLPQTGVAKGDVTTATAFPDNVEEVAGSAMNEYTFNEVIHEFEKLYRESEAYRDLYDDPLIKSEFENSLAIAVKRFSTLRTYIETGGRVAPAFLGCAGQLFAPEDSILSFCQGKDQTDSIRLISWLYEEIRRTTSNFLALNLFHRILQLRKNADPVEKIVVIAEKKFCRMLYFHLMRSKCTTFVYGIQDDNFDVAEFVKVHVPFSELEEKITNYSKESIIADAGNALLHAARAGSTETCVALLEKGSPVDATIKDGRTSLHFAAYKGRSELCAVLIKNGASAAAVDERGWTSLHFAACSGDIECCSLLIMNGADVNAINKQGITPPHLASCHGHAKLCTFMLSNLFTRAFLIPQGIDSNPFINRMWGKFSALFSDNSPHARIKTALLCMYRLPRLPQVIYHLILRRHPEVAYDIFQILLPRINQGHATQSLSDCMSIIPLFIPLCTDQIFQHTIEFVKEDLSKTLQTSPLAEDKKTELIKLIAAAKKNCGSELYQNIYRRLSVLPPR